MQQVRSVLSQAFHQTHVLVNVVKVFIVLLDRFELHRISAVEFKSFVQQELAHPPLCLLVSTQVP